MIRRDFLNRKKEIETILSDFGLDSLERVEDLIEELEQINTTLKS